MGQRQGGGALACWLCAFAIVAASCAQGRHADDERGGADASATSAPDEARERIRELRARFVPAAVAAPPLAQHSPAREPGPVLAAGVATEMPATRDGRLHPIVPGGGSGRRASVTLPRRANGAVRVGDDASGLSVEVALVDATDAEVVVADGLARYPRAFRGSDVIQRPTAEGTEDFVVFEAAPTREALEYDVDVSRAAGLRLVGDELELVDASGAPRLRMAAPYVVDARGERHDARVAVEGCAIDPSPAAPWGRAPVDPGARRCRVRVTWRSDVYPAIVDPSWVVAGAMTTTRYGFAYSVLASGKILFSGGMSNGSTNSYLTSAELYDPTTDTFAATGGMTGKREKHASVRLASGKVLVAGGYDGSSTNNGILSTAEVYDPATGSFSPTGALTLARISPTATLVNTGKALIAGGGGAFGNFVGAELYDPSTGTFTATGSMSVARNGHTATLLSSGKVLVAGGDTGVAPSVGTTSSAEAYDPATGTFSAAANMNAERSGHSATTLASGKILFAGGGYWYSSSVRPALSSAEVYDPATNAFTLVGSMTTARADVFAALLGSGRVLVTGGTSTTADLFDPTTGNFTGTLPSTSLHASAVLLPSSDVLEAGGAAPTAERYSTRGTACAKAADCNSGACDDGVCCSSTCGGTCQTCAAGTGACVAVKSADDPDTCTGVSTCDATGACKLKNGQGCPSGGTSCASGICADAVCCNTACAAGACDRCDLAGSPGTCTVAPAGDPGSPACGNGLACDGTNATCPSTCISDVDCLPADYCDATGACKPRKAQGQACSAATDCKVAGCRECTTGFCVDGVCCESACTATCSACAAALQQPAGDGGAPGDGLCRPAKDDTNPHHDNCPVDAPSTCGHDGQCDGTGGCRLYYPPGASCGPSQCIAGNKASGSICNGSGTCTSDPSGQSCGNYVCANGSCPNTCATSTDCVPSAYCEQGACVPKDANGATCTSAESCTSNFCVDGVCCNALCQGQCEACDVGGSVGTCAAVVGDPHGSRAACPVADPKSPCATAKCDGVTTTTCAGFAGPQTPCGQASCVGGQAHAAGMCDGQGGCRTPPASSCGDYACVAGVCNTHCSSSSDCAPGATCQGGTCASGSTCDVDGHTVVDSAGAKKACDPYGCAHGLCVTSCQSVADCAPPNVCDPSGRCVAPEAMSGGDSGGCSMSAGAAGRASYGVCCIALAMMLGARMRRRGERRPERVIGERNGSTARMAKRASRVAVIGSLACVVAMASCTRGDGGAPAASLREDGGGVAPAVAMSPAARGRIEEVRSLFAPLERALTPAPVERFELDRTGGVRAVVGEDTNAGIARATRVTLPASAAGAAEVRDEVSGVAVRFLLAGARRGATIDAEGGVALYARALEDADVIQRVRREGTEDYVVFDAAPSREELTYLVDVSRAAGLRLVASTLELLDDAGTPRLRVAPPRVLDAAGAWHEATLAVDGCAYDASAAPPWGRPITRPGASTCGVRVAWNGVRYPAVVDPSWATTGTMIDVRSAPTAELLASGRVLVVGGIGSSSYLSSAEIYDPATATFAATGPLATARCHHTETVLPTGRVLIAGGSNAAYTYLTSGELYDPAAGTFAPTGSMATPRAYHTATLLGSGKVLIVGGMTSGSPTTGAELYDPSTGKFAPTNGAPTTWRYQHTATMLASGKVLLAGGQTCGSQCVPISTAEVYDPTAGTFAATAAMTTQRANHAAARLSSGKVLLTAGRGAWSALQSTAELFDPTTGTFAATGALSSVRELLTMAVLPSGDALAAGGGVATAELYDPAAGAFHLIAPMTTSRSGHTMTLLPSGRALVAGGSGDNTAELSPDVVNGGACTAPGDCFSGVCDDGVCCSGPCNGTCQTCVPGTGACVNVVDAPDPDTCNGTCDANHACTLGRPCAQPTDCPSGSCSDGVCCNAPCSGQCDVCTKTLGAPADGLCTILAQGAVGVPACGSGYACDGTSASCVIPCVADADCAADHFCDATGKCAARRAQGQACNVASDCKTAACRECTTGYCVDGVCCESACTSLCAACAGALQQGGADGGVSGDGFCRPAKDDTNPHGDPCPTDAPASCGRDGKCDGTGGCRLYYPPGTSCGVSQCIAGNKAAGDICNGSGTCTADPNGQPCGEFVCANGSCPTTCARDADCVQGAYCDQGTCVAKGQNGASCTSAIGCASGYCVDGVCCNRACDGQCEACDVGVSAGTCTAIVGAPHGARPGCGTGDPQNVCSHMQCDGLASTSCAGFVGPTTSCGAAACVNGQAQAKGACDGRGTCRVPAPSSCGDYACVNGACKTTCASDVDCANGSKCASGTCTTGATCDPDGHTAVDPSGRRTACEPFVCSGGQCKTSCGSVSDCASPNVCDPSGACVAPAASTGGDSGGCGVGTGSNRGGSVALLAMALALALARRRRV